MSMLEATENKIIQGAATLFAVAGIVAVSVYTVWHTNSGVPALLASQAFPAGLNIMTRQVVRLWPALAARLKIQ